jgi:hypothetical protein
MKTNYLSNILKRRKNKIGRLEGLDQNLRVYINKNCLIKNLTCKTLEEKSCEGKKREQCSKERLTKLYSEKPNLFLAKPRTILTRIVSTNESLVTKVTD